MNREGIPKPPKLTKYFITKLNEQLNDHVGYFQIIEFHKKKQKYYSAQISDGYFKSKAFFKGENAT